MSYPPRVSSSRSSSCGTKLELIVNVAATEKYNPKLAALNEQLSPYIDGNPVRIDGKPRASGILDTVSFDDLSLPRSFDNNLV